MALVLLLLICSCTVEAFLPGRITSFGRQDAGEAWAQTGGSLDGVPGSRENALGGAGVALIADPSDAPWWNPAALGFGDQASAQVTQSNLPGFANDDGYYYNVSGAIPLGSLGGMGFVLSDLSYPSFSSFLEYSYSGPRELSRGGSVGLQLFPNLAIGATVKWTRIRLASSEPGTEAWRDTPAIQTSTVWRSAWVTTTIAWEMSAR